MTTLHYYETRTTLLRLPVPSFGRFRGSLVLELTERVELELDRSLREAPARRRRVAQAMDRADAHRTRALGNRLGGSL